MLDWTLGRKIVMRPWMLGLLALAALFAGCGEDVCQQAVAKIRDCAAGKPALEDMSRLEFRGACNNEAQIAAGKTVAFKSWSERYLDCAIDEATCQCPGLPWYDVYTPD
jgi:hypothetical protein